MDVMFYGDNRLAEEVPITIGNVRTELPKMRELNDSLVIIQARFNINGRSIIAEDFLADSRLNNWEGQAMIIWLGRNEPTGNNFSQFQLDQYVRTTGIKDLQKSLNDFKRYLNKEFKNDADRELRTSYFDYIRKCQYTVTGRLESIKHKVSKEIQDNKDDFSTCMEVIRRAEREILQTYIRSPKSTRAFCHKALAKAPFSDTTLTKFSGFLTPQVLLDSFSQLIDQLITWVRTRPASRKTGKIILYVGRAVDVQILTEKLKKYSAPKDTVIHHANSLAEAQQISENNQNIQVLLSGYHFYKKGFLSKCNGTTILKVLSETSGITHRGFVTSIPLRDISFPEEMNAEHLFDRIKLQADDKHELPRFFRFLFEPNIINIVDNDCWPKKLKGKSKADKECKILYEEFLLKKDISLIIDDQLKGDFETVQNLMKKGNSGIQLRCASTPIIQTKEINKESRFRDIMSHRRIVLALYNHPDLLKSGYARDFPENDYSTLGQRKFAIIYSMIGTMKFTRRMRNNQENFQKYNSAVGKLYNNTLRILRQNNYSHENLELDQYITKLERYWLTYFIKKINEK